MVSINPVILNNTKMSSALSFCGHNLSENDKGEKIYKFYIPKVSYCRAQVNLIKLKLNDKGEIDTNSATPEIIKHIPQNQAYIEINPKDKDIKLRKNEVLGYRFIIDDKEYTDTFRNKMIKGTTYNIADMLSCEVLETPKAMYHLIPSVFNPKNPDGKNLRTNHFFKFDTSLQDVIAKIPYIKDLGFRRILSTPIFGQDNLSSHGYWTCNPYQITERLGTKEDFKQLQIELFKNGMGFVADGAFVNEGLMGVHFRDIIRNGKDSPYINWLETYDFPAKPLKLGILPDKEEAMKNIGFRVVNSPVIWSVNSDGSKASDFGVKNPNYNPSRETFVQIYDKRLASAVLKKDEVFNTYDNNSTANPNEIQDWMDSVQPYAFPVKAVDVRSRAKKAQKSSESPDSFLKNWGTFEIVPAQKSSGITLWNGNKDIAKLRFTAPIAKSDYIENHSSDLIDMATQNECIKSAAKNIQDFICNVGKFWTNQTAKSIREYIAKNISDTTDANTIRNEIISKAGSVFPESVKYLTTSQIQNALDSKYLSSQNLYVPENIKDGLKEYPLEALEVADDLTAIFGYPEFNIYAENSLYPELNAMTSEILSKLDEKNLSCGKLLEDGDLTFRNKDVANLLFDDIVRFLMVKSLKPSFDNNQIFSWDKISLENLKSISGLSLKLDLTNPSATVKSLMYLIRTNLASLSNEDKNFLVEHLKNKLANIDANKIKIANLIIDKTESGLNWRMDAAKDISDIESYTEGQNTMAGAWNEVFTFWKKFNDGVRMYNNHSYKIGEFTDMDQPYAAINENMINAGKIEQKIIEQAGFTTQTNYNYLFELLQRFHGGKAEYESCINTANAASIIRDKFIAGWPGVSGFLFSGNKNNIAYSHVAVGNHDKPRVGHTFSINPLLVYNGDTSSFAEQCLEDFKYSKYENLISNRNFKTLFEYVSQENLAKMQALNMALNSALKQTQTDEEFSDNTRRAFAVALDKLASREHEDSRNFFYKTFETNYEDIVAEIEKIDENKSIAEQLKRIQPEVHRQYMLPAQKREIEMAKLMVALPGNPSWYAGDELLETGSEEKAKNVSVQNRNPLHWKYLTDDRYKHVKEFHDEISKIFNLRNDKNSSCLVNGDTIILSENKDNHFTSLYRYNDHDDAIILLHNKGYNESRTFQPYSLSMEKICISDKFPDGTKLPKDTEFEDVMDSSKVYIIDEDGNLKSKSGPVNLTDSVTILKRVK